MKLYLSIFLFLFFINLRVNFCEEERYCEKNYCEEKINLNKKLDEAINESIIPHSEFINYLDDLLWEEDYKVLVNNIKKQMILSRKDENENCFYDYVEENIKLIHEKDYNTYKNIDDIRNKEVMTTPKLNYFQRKLSKQGFSSYIRDKIIITDGKKHLLKLLRINWSPAYSKQFFADTQFSVKKITDNLYLKVENKISDSKK